jgi:oligosaccharide repeat unit polymerase
LYPYFDVEKYRLQITDFTISKRMKVLMYFWVFCSIIEVIQARNFPFLSLLGIGPYINYVDFGIGGLHGLLNAIYLFLACFYFLRYKADNKKRYLYVLFLLLLWPILLTTRQLLLSYFIQLFFIHLLTTKINTKKVLKLFCIVLLAFSIFGYLGDLRSGREHIISLASPTFDYPDYLPSFFIWVYIYIVSPLNNVNHNVAEIIPLYFPFNIVISIFPSVFRDVITSGLDVKSYNTELVTEAFNVSSFYQPFLLDFGYKLLPFVLLVFSSISMVVMHKANNKVPYVIILAIMLHSITLSVFANFFTHIVFVFQMILSFLIFKLKVR